MCMKKCHAKEFFFLQSDCLSNLAILYGLCILDISFPYWPLLCGGVSNKHCLLSFFYFDGPEPLQFTWQFKLVTKFFAYLKE